MNIGELVRNVEATRPKPPPNDLLNADRCECGICSSDCASPIPGQPKKLS